MSVKEKSRKEKRQNKIFTGVIIVGALTAIVIGIVLNENNTNNDTKVNETQISDAFEIETKYCSLYYPEKWKNHVDIRYSETAGYKVEFYGSIEGKEEMHLFDVCFNSDDGTLLGYFDRKEVVNISVDVMEISFGADWTQKEMDQIYSMQEDVNFVIEKLELEEDYVNPET